MQKEILFFVTPLLVAGLLHHFLIIPKNMFSFLARPIDAGVLWKRKRLLGDAKTWRGIVVMAVGTSIAMEVLHFFLPLTLRVSPWVAGGAIGLAYALFELPNSFVKRRMGVPEGKGGLGLLNKILFFADQSDSVIGSVASLYLVYHPTVQLAGTLLVLGIGVHTLVDLIVRRWGYKRSLHQ